MELEQRVRQILEAQIGNLIMDLAIKSAQIEALQAELAKHDPPKDPPRGDV